MNIRQAVPPEAPVMKAWEAHKATEEFANTLKWAGEEKLPLLTALARVTCDPAAILGIGSGSLAVGSPADLCVFDLTEPWRVTPGALRSQGKNTPIMGYEMAGRVHLTLVGGRVVFEL